MTMRAIVLREYGPAENLKLEELPVPEPGPGQVLVRTEAIGVSYTETLLRSGVFPAPLPLTFGFEAAGQVVQAGEGTDPDLAGRRVVVMHTGLGCYAEYVAVPAAAATVIPDELSAADAVAVANYGAVAVCLLRAARLTGTETVLIESAAGGVGGYLTQLAHEFGAKTVIGTAGSQARREQAQALGADQARDHRDADWTSGLSGIDVVFESLGGETTARLADALTPLTGKFVLYGYLQGPPAITAMDLLTRGLTLTGCAGPDWLELVEATKAEVLQMAVEGRIRPRIDSVLGLEQAPQAHRRFDEGLALGKVILTP